MPHFKHSKVISDIKELVRLLKFYQFEYTMELYQLENLIGKSQDVFYDYNIDNLTFRISTSGMSPYPKVSKLTVSIDANYSLQTEMSEKNDIFRIYSLELFIRGYTDKTAGEAEVSNFFCWHLDREENTTGDFIHPLYHLHAGGNQLKDGNIDAGGLVFIGSPRIPHPPMDIILAIHFVIQNFINSGDFEQKNKLLADDDYQDLVERARKRVLDPYFQSIVGANHNSFTKQNLFPLYL